MPTASPSESRFRGDRIRGSKAGWDDGVVEILIIGGHRFAVTRARERDVPAVVKLLANDVLGADRESSELGPYFKAFAEIDADPHHLLVIVRDDADTVVGTMQLTLVPGLARAGAKRLQIEAVRLAPDARGGGLGTALFNWAHEYGRQHGATIAQLTSDKSRTDAHRFYDKVGYTASHQGFKRAL